MNRVPPFTVQDLVRATRGALVAGDLGIPVTGVSIDSRSLGVGEAFFAIRGHRLDGHAFLAEAARLPVRTHTQLFPLDQANEALQALKHDAIRGAAVLQP